MSDSAKSTWGLILGILGILLTLWFQRKTIRDEFRNWDKSTLETLLCEIKSPAYILKHRYLRNRDALMGLTAITAAIPLAAMTFTAMYPTVNRSLTALTVVLQMLLGYFAVACLLSALWENKLATEAHVQARIKKLSKAYKKYKDPDAQQLVNSTPTE